MASRIASRSSLAAVALDDLTRPKRVVWDNEELDQLIEAIYEQMVIHPGDSPHQNCERAQKHLVETRKWSKDRVRNLQSIKQHPPLLIRLRDKLKAKHELSQETLQLREQLSHVPSEEEFFETLPDEVIRERFTAKVLAGLTPDEVCKHFLTDEMLGAVPLAKLCGFAVERYITEVQQKEIRVHHHVSSPPVALSISPHQNGHSKNGHSQNGNGHMKPVTKIPKVLFIGGTPEQFQRLVNHFKGELEIILGRKERLETGLPKQVDHVVVWANFINKLGKALIKEHVEKIELPASHHHVVTGGQTAIRDVLTSIVEAQ